MVSLIWKSGVKKNYLTFSLFHVMLSTRIKLYQIETIKNNFGILFMIETIF